MRNGRLRSLACIGVLVAAACSAIPSAATVHRSPTPDEVAEITAATEEAQASPIGFSLNDVRISSDGFWAAAIVRPNLPPRQAQNAVAIYRLEASHWALVQIGSEACYGNKLRFSGLSNRIGDELELVPCNHHPIHPRPCAAEIRDGCRVRPHKMITGAHTWIQGIRWQTWDERTALGFGKLVELGGYTYPGFTKPAKIRLGLPERCQGREWFRSMTVKYGRHFGKRYLYEQDFTPC